MFVNFYKKYLKQFYFVRLLRLLAGKTVWTVRWKVVYPVKRAFANFFRKMSFFCFSWDGSYFLDNFVPERPRSALRNFSDFTSEKVAPVFDFFIVKLVKPLARRTIPRHIRTKLLSFEFRKMFMLFGGSRELALLAIRDAAAEKRIKPSAELFSKEEVLTGAPIVFPPSLGDEVGLVADSYIFPAITAVEIVNATVEGLSNFVETHEAVLHHDLYQLTYDYTSEELHGRFAIFPRRKIIRKFGKSEPGAVLEAAAVFTDACSPNYAHWLTEVLPRIHVGAKSGMDESIPFIVDAGLHANILFSARLLAGAHPLVELKRGESIQVKKLYVVGATGYIPFDRRPAKEGVYSHGVFSPSALKSMRAELSALMGPADGDYPRKIMLRRSSGARSMKNEEALALKLQELGFSSIYPEKLSFSQQYHLFSNAECVVGATGAAMANLVFCQPACRLIICISSHKEHSFGYWRNMASAMGNNIRYVLGPVVGEKNQGVHADFVVDVDDVVFAINY
ncbi:DUF563 domain-containing protein [Pantoea sp. 18069]|uniref:glycosyltransferase family 61 protein n=1 Tax=Pantoea sp. 18069 TaxID=2681415 RepID=UPI00135B679E|nr:glycosyltransferase 61 family protein [Pantoea sp. 18069]